MALGDIKLRQSVLKAIAEFDELKRDAFLAKYGFGRSRSYFLRHNEALYDSKAIIGAAHGFEFGTALGPDKFSGGDRTVKRKLEELGFKVIVEWMDTDARSVDDLRTGATIDNARLIALFDVGTMGGMRRSTARGHLVVVSDHTKSLYEDRWEGDILHYTGMGTIGDQTLTGQNRTLAELATNGVKVYLFEVFVAGRYIFHGPVDLASAPYQEDQPGEDGRLRKVWMFPLKLLSSDYDPVPTQEQLNRIREFRQRVLRRKSTEELRLRAQASERVPPTRTATVEQIIRDEAVAAYVKRLANGKCDLCRRDAPFISKDKEPFLECHHIHHLADGGDDTIENAVALCPNCHRKMHALGLASDKAALRARVSAREADIAA